MFEAFDMFQYQAMEGNVPTMLVENNDDELRSITTASTLTMGSEWNDTWSRRSDGTSTVGKTPSRKSISDKHPSRKSIKDKYKRSKSSKSSRVQPTAPDHDQSLSKCYESYTDYSSATSMDSYSWGKENGSKASCSKRLGIMRPSYGGNNDVATNFNPMFGIHPVAQKENQLPQEPSIQNNEEESTSSYSSDGISRFYHKQTAESYSAQKTRAKSHQMKNNGLDGVLKIFLLLIQPAKKKFELTEATFFSTKGTIGHIIDLIPTISTDEAIGKQDYRGFCRPTDGIEMTDTNYLASGKFCRILQGEILVAIPMGFTGLQCLHLSKPILNHPALKKLLKRDNPLAPKSSSRKPFQDIANTDFNPRTSSKPQFVQNEIVSTVSHDVKYAATKNKDCSESVCSVSSTKSFFTQFLENERAYYNNTQRDDDMTTVSIGKALDTVAFSMEKVIFQAIGSMTEFVSKIVAPGDYEEGRRPKTHSIVKRKGTKRHKIDLFASLKVFAAFMSMIIVRFVFEPKMITMPLGAEGMFACVAMFSMLTKAQKWFPLCSSEKDSNPKRKTKKTKQKFYQKIKYDYTDIPQLNDF